MEELNVILERFIASSCELIAIPARQWLERNCEKAVLVAAVRQAERECGGCDLDPLYRRALELL